MSAKVFKFRSDLAQSQGEQERAWKAQRRIKRPSARRFTPNWKGIAVVAMFLAVAVFVGMAIWRGSGPAAASAPWKDWNPE